MTERRYPDEPTPASAVRSRVPHPYGELPKDAGPEKRILHATVYLIESLGIEKLTTRAIATAAQVNLALVNYYYRSKAALVKAALSMGLGNMLADVASFFSEPWPSGRECLAAILEYLIGGAMHAPRLSAAVLRCPADYLTVGPSPAEKLGGIILEATRDLAHELGVQDEGAIAMRAALLEAAVLFPTFEPGLFGAGMNAPIDAASLSSRDSQHALATLLVADAAAAFEREARSRGETPPPVAEGGETGGTEWQ